MHYNAAAHAVLCPRFQRVVDAEHALRARKNKRQLLDEAITNFNRKESHRLFKINTEETAAIKFLAERSPVFCKRVKLAWGVERPEFSALPLTLLGKDFLKASTPLPVPGAYLLKNC